MTYKQFGEKYIMRFEFQDNFGQEFERFALETGADLGSFTGIGSFLSCELGYFDLKKKEFRKKVVTENHEVTSLLGNLSTKQSKPYFHTHVTLGDKNFNTKAGHLYQATVGATLEIVFEKIVGNVGRKFSDGVGLNLLDF